VLGLIENRYNYSELTPLGREYVGLQTDAGRMDFLGRCLVEIPGFHEVLKYIIGHNPSYSQLKAWFRTLYEGSSNTADRRFTTAMNYLRDAGLIDQRGTGFVVKKFVGAVAKETTETKEGIGGKSIQRDFKEVTGSDGENQTIKFEVDAQKKERANHVHWNLVTGKSTFLVERGFNALENEHVDLFTAYKDEVVLYEMKSINESNLGLQVRRAVGQLYEYRYIFGVPKAILCIVTNSGISKENRWIADYLAKDRLIAYEWSDDYRTFECSEESKNLLEAFSP
jgi:hypothetical protein